MHNFGKRAGLRPVFLFLALGLSLWVGPALAQETSDASTTENDLERPPPLDPDPGRPPEPDPDLERPPGLDSDLEIPPPLPPKIQDDQIVPTVTIREEENNLIEEYSYNGLVYMVKVTPQVGKPYYFMDLDGDGVLERDERSRAFQPVEPAQWKVKEWE